MFICFFMGLILGVVLMCLLQVNNENYKAKRIKELEAEILTSKYFKKGDKNG